MFTLRLHTQVSALEISFLCGFAVPAFHSSPATSIKVKVWETLNLQRFPYFLCGGKCMY